MEIIRYTVFYIHIYTYMTLSSLLWSLDSAAGRRYDPSKVSYTKRQRTNQQKGDLGNLPPKVKPQLCRNFLLRRKPGTLQDLDVKPPLPPPPHAPNNHASCILYQAPTAACLRFSPKNKGQLTSWKFCKTRTPLCTYAPEYSSDNPWWYCWISTLCSRILIGHKWYTCYTRPK